MKFSKTKWQRTRIFTYDEHTRIHEYECCKQFPAQQQLFATQMQALMKTFSLFSCYRAIGRILKERK